MKFVKGLVVGTAISAGIMMMYDGMNKKNIIKKGKQMAKKWDLWYAQGI